MHSRRVSEEERSQFYALAAYPVRPIKRLSETLLDRSGVLLFHFSALEMPLDHATKGALAHRLDITVRLRVGSSFLDRLMAKLKTVLIVADFAHINGGQAKVAIDSALIMAKAGLDVIFFAASGPVGPELDHPGISVVCLNQNDILSDPNRSRAALRGIWNTDAASELSKLALALDPEASILHCHGYAKALSPSIGPLLTDGPLAAVYTMHEYFLACPNGGFYDYKKNEICTRKALGVSCLLTNCDVRHPAHKAWRVVRQFATHLPGGLPRRLRDVIFISRTQMEIMAPYMAGSTRMHYVSNPIEELPAPPVNVAQNDIFLFVGRLNPEKGGLVFAKAAKCANVRAVFVGDGAEAQAIREANPDAIITGWQTPGQVQDWIGKARALVFPSLWYECQPLVPMEAISRGVPVICGSWSAAAELVVDGENGVVYSNATVSALADAILALNERRIAPGQPMPLGDSRSHLAELLHIYEDMLHRHASIR